MANWKFEPYVGVGPVKFGMTPDQVKKALGDAKASRTTWGGKLEDDYGDITVRYNDELGTVCEIAFDLDCELLLKGVLLFQSENLTEYLLSLDPCPFELLGFLIFLDLGIATTGFHDDDDDQRALTVFEKGHWDKMKDDLKPFQTVH